MKSRKKQTGFTIVELLIVIVVIAILAAIAVVAYNGIQDRARNSALLSGIDTIEKALKVYAVEHGQYPKPTDIPGQLSGQPGMYSITCLQPNNGGWPARDTLSSSECYKSNGTAPAYAGYSDIVNDALASVLSSVPDTSDYTKSVTGGEAARGIIYQYMGGPQPGYPLGAAYLYYLVGGDQECGRGQKQSMSGGATTGCITTLQ